MKKIILAIALLSLPMLAQSEMSDEMIHENYVQDQQATQTLRKYHHMRKLDPRNASAWHEDGKAAEWKSRLAVFSSREALWQQRALEDFSEAQKLSPSAKDIKESLSDLEKKLIDANFRFDIDFGVIGVGSSSLHGEFLPMHFLWTRPGIAFVLHPFTFDYRSDGRQDGVDFSSPGTIDKFDVLMYEIVGLGLQYRLAQFAGGPSQGFWFPYAGRGCSLNLYADLYPFALSQAMGSNPKNPSPYLWDWQTASNTGEFFAPGKLLLAQAYEAGICLNSSLVSLSLGYSMAIIAGGTVKSTSPKRTEVLDSAVFSGAFARINLKFF